MTPVRDALLLAWRDALLRYVEMPLWPTVDELNDARRSGVVWLKWTQLTPTPDDHPDATHYRRALDALELLALLAQVDYAAWLRFLTDLWPRATSRWVDALYPATFRLGLDVCMGTSSGELTTWAERAWPRDFAASRVVHNAYWTVREELAVMVGDDDGNDAVATAPPVVEIRIVFPPTIGPDDDAFDRLHMELLQVVKANATLRQGRVLWWPRRTRLFWLVEVQADEWGIDCFQAETEMPYSAEILQCGLRVSMMSLLEADLIESSLVVHQIATLQRTIVDPGAFGLCAVETVLIDSHATCQTLDAIYSSLLLSETVRNIIVDSNTNFQDRDERGQRFMQWLVLCAFGPAGCCSLQMLSLDLNMITLHDLAILKRTLHDENAFLALFTDATALDKKDTHGFVATATRFVLTRPDEGNPQLRAVSFPAPQQRLRVLAIDQDWVSVLLPGWGQAWVGVSEVQLDESASGWSELISKKHEPLRHLILELVQDRVVLVELIKVVGANLEALSIGWVLDPPPVENDWIRDTCLACTNLDDIVLEGINLAALDVIACCYDDGICRASRLDFNIESAGETEFFSSLTDHERSVTCVVQELTITFSTPWSSPWLRLLLPSMVNMLADNRRLSRVAITMAVQCDEATTQLVTEFDTAIKQLDDQRVAIRTGPLHIASKVAFLSVLKNAPPHSARSSIDTLVLHKIFEFAAEFKIRRVHFGVL